ncbi:MAG: hypothetical protein ACP5XB_13915 [Isosphaeraceae bacterium]
MPTRIDRPHRIDRSRALLATLLLSMPPALVGCGGPSVNDVKNARAFEALLTAVSLKHMAEVEQDARLIDARHAEGGLSESEYREISEIIAKARAKNWSVAEKNAYAFRERNPAF